MPILDLERVQPHESKIYYEFSRFYDRIFARVFYPRIATVVRSLQIPPGARVLEVGVGTGLSLDAYPRHAQVVGIDIAPDMLEIAREKVERNGWRHVALLEMDAQKMTFPDDHFDYATAFHVVSVVPDARRLMGELARVCKPGATVAVINHFRSRNRLFSALDSSLAPITYRLGWKTLSLEEVLDGAPITPVQIYKTSPRSLFTIVVARNEKRGPAGGSEIAAAS